MKISIDPKILENFPDAKIGWLHANVADADGAAHVRALKAGLEARLNDIGISADTMMMHPDVRRWREVSENEKAFGKALIFVGLAEGVALYGLIVSLLLLFV